MSRIADGYRFGITTYCPSSHLDANAYEFSIESWLTNTSCSEIVVFTDCALPKAKAGRHAAVKFVDLHVIHGETPESFQPEHKIEAIRYYYERSPLPYFLYLEPACWVHRDIAEVFQSMPSLHVIATRILGRAHEPTGDDTKDGVIFFRNDPALAEFFCMWRSRAAKYRIERGSRCAQDALSDILLESFDGLHLFKAGMVSARIYNSEHDNNVAWMKKVRTHSPKILHFGQRRYLNESLRRAMLSCIDKVSLNISKEEKR
jgi:hypothetical protein